MTIIHLINVANAMRFYCKNTVVISYDYVHLQEIIALVMLQPCYTNKVK